MTFDDLRIGDIVQFHDHEFGLIVARVMGDDPDSQEFGLVLEDADSTTEWRSFVEPLVPGTTEKFSSREPSYVREPAYLDDDGYNESPHKLFVRTNTMTIVQRPEVP